MLFKKCTVCLNIFLLFRRSKYNKVQTYDEYTYNVYLVCYIIVIRVGYKNKNTNQNKYALRNFRSNTRTRIFYISIYT